MTLDDSAIQSVDDVQPLTGRLIETAWLIGLLAVPVLFTPGRYLTFYNDPKYFVVHLVAVVTAAAWAFERASGAASPRRWRIRSPLRWAGRRPERWAVVSAAALVASAVVSTLASPAPRVSLWGRDFISLGYELYTFLALLAVFFAVAVRLRTLEQAGRALMAVTVAGGLTAAYGISQDMGWDPAGPGEEFSRNFSSLGNPIFFGAVLVMAMPATLGVALEARRSRRTWMLVFATVVMGLELAGLWTSQSRGPFIGSAAVLLAFAGAGWLWLERRTFFAGLAVVGSGVVIALLISLLPAGDSSSAGRSLEELGDIFDSDQATSIGGRADAWDGALELASTWERFPAESGVRNALRPLVGLGPDMYFYSYPLSIERDPSGIGRFFAHAHNYPVQLFLELGLLGLVSFVALVLLAAYAALATLRAEKEAGRSDGLLAIFTAVLLAALIGRGVEQMAGVAQVSDLITFWAVAGLLLALAGISRRVRTPGAENGSAPNRGRARPAPVPRRRGPSAVPAGLALAALVIGVGVFFVRDVRGIGASRVAAQGFDLIADGRDQEGLGKYERAADLNPEVELYALQVDFMIRAEAEVREDPAEKVALNELSLAVLEKYEARDPFAHATQRRIAKTELALGRLGQLDRFRSAAERYTKLAAEMRSFPTIQALAADGIVAAADGLREAGELQLASEYTELGLAYADRAIAFETPAQRSPRAWWARGVALERLGRLDEAIAAYLGSLDRRDGSIYESEAHKGLSRVYARIGDAVNAEAHRLLAETGEPDG